MQFGAIAIGPPGSGKSTFCNGMKQFMEALGRRVEIVNLDPANDCLSYRPAIDIQDLITVQDAMEAYSLGPNGALVYCMEFLEKNFTWLQEKLLDLINEKNDANSIYFLFDCPGQVELFTHNSALKTVIDKISRNLHFQLCAVHLVDSLHCVDAHRFISILLLSMKTMLHLELPHLNVLSKLDLLPSKENELAFNFDYYLQVQDLSYLLHHLNSPTGKSKFGHKFHALNEALVDLIQDFSLVSFMSLQVEDKESMHELMCAMDKSNGFIFGTDQESNEFILETASTR